MSMDVKSVLSAKFLFMLVVSRVVFSLFILFVCSSGLLPAPAYSQAASHPDKSQHLRSQIEELLYQGEYVKANPLVKQLLKTKAHSDELVQNAKIMARFYLFNKSYDEAISLYEGLKSPEGLGASFLATKQFDKALEEFAHFADQRGGLTQEQRLASDIGHALAYEGHGKYDMDHDISFPIVSNIEHSWRDVEAEERSTFLTDPVGIMFTRLDFYECLLRIVQKKIAGETSKLRILWYVEWLGSEILLEMLDAWDQGCQDKDHSRSIARKKFFQERIAKLRQGVTALIAYKIPGVKAMAVNRDLPFMVVNPDGKVTLLLGVRGGKLFLQQLNIDGTLINDTVEVLSTPENSDITYFAKDTSIALLWKAARPNKNFKPQSANMPVYMDLYYKEIGFDGKIITDEKRLTNKQTADMNIEKMQLEGGLKGTFKEMRKRIVLMWSMESIASICLGRLTEILIDSQNNRHLIQDCGGHMESQTSLWYGKNDQHGDTLLAPEELVVYNKKVGEEWGASILHLSAELDKQDNMHLLWKVNDGTNSFSYQYMKIKSDGQKVVYTP